MSSNVTDVKYAKGEKLRSTNISDSTYGLHDYS